ncbi:uncharacterized protein LOC102803667 [Saccoglossus kowalevskii]
MSDALQFCHHKEGASSPVRQLADVYWNWRLKIRPEFATLTGCHVYDDQLDCHTLETYDDMKKQGEEFLRQLNYLDESDMDAEDWTNYVILKQELSMFLSGIEFKGYLLCLNSLEDGRFYFARVINRMTFENEGDYTKLLSRYEKFPEQMKWFIQLLKQGIKEGMTHHVNCVKGMVENNEKFSLSDPKDTAFYTPFQKLAELTNIPKNRKEEIKSQGIHLVVNNIQEPFKTLVDFLKNEYFHHLRTNIGSSALPNGKAFYEESLKFHITCDLSAEVVHNIGFREVKRIKENMHRVMKQVGFQGDIKSFFECLRNDKRFYFKTKEVSTNAETQNGAYYYGPSADGSKPGVFNVNCHNFQARPKFEMMSLCLHEAEPGHHLQSSYSVLMDYLPGFRRFKDDRFYGIVPSRFPMHTGYIEIIIKNILTSCIGDKFDLKEFHDAVLSCGPVTLTVLELLINKYINTTLEIPDRK